MRKLNLLLALLAGTSLIVLFQNAGMVTSADLTFWVSPTGDDTLGDGSSAKPWKTIVKARNFIRTIPTSEIDTHIVVNIKAGHYFINQPIEFSPIDSGRNGYSVIYRSVDGDGKAVIHSGLRIASWTKVSGKSYWSADLSQLGLTSSQLASVTSLYENGQRARVARSPNLTKDKRYLISHAPYNLSVNGGVSGDLDFMNFNVGSNLFTNDDLSNSTRVIAWSKPGGHAWGMMSNKIDSITSSSMLLIPRPKREPLVKNTRYYVEGVQKFLDQRGEFFYDSTIKKLFYYPLSNNNPNDPSLMNISMPLLDKLIVIQGSISSSGAVTPTHHLQFIGLGLAYTKTTDVLSAAFYTKQTNNVILRNCEIYNVGYAAVAMVQDNQTNTVYGCSLHHLGVGGVIVDNSGIDRFTHPHRKSEGHLISNTKISNIGEERINAIHTTGVLLYSTNDVSVSYMDISKSGRYGISLRGHYSTESKPKCDKGIHYAKNNRFNFIRIEDSLMDSGDGGALHLAHCNGGTRNQHNDGCETDDPGMGQQINYWNQIVISGVYAHPTMKDPQVPNGVFIDHANSCVNQNFSNIRVTYTQGVPFRTNNNPNQKLQNVSWNSQTYLPQNVQEGTIGLKSDFPKNYIGRLETIVDDRTADYRESDTSWVDSTISNLHQGDGRFHSGKSTAYAEWRPSLPFDSLYEVFVWRMSPHSAASTAAPYEITHVNGKKMVYVNQQTGPVGWVSLGTYSFKAGKNSNGYVRLLTNPKDGLAVRADAVKFIKK